MMPSFQNKSVVVTGAASGIGLASALAFARQGADLLLADINEADGMAALAKVRELGGKAEFITVDLTRSEDVGQLITRAIACFGQLDIVHNNAGISGSNAFTADIPEKEFDQIVAVNLKAVWLVMKHAIKQMQAQKRGVIVNSASALSLTVLPGSAAYNATKHAVAGLTKTAAVEYASQNIRINAICPGVIRTSMLDSRPDLAELEPKLVAIHPIGRLGEVAEVAEAILWLASDGASFMHGSLMTVDGGWTAS